MARHRPAPAPGPDLRGLLADHYRELAARRRDRVPTGRDDGSYFGNPYAAKVANLVDGMAVDVYGFELKRWRPDLEAQGRYRLEVDGTVTVLTRGGN